MSDPTRDESTIPHLPPRVDPNDPTEVFRPPHIASKPDSANPPGEAPRYDLIRPLGRGTFGEVWLATQYGSGLTVAVKFFALHTTDWRGVYQEIQSLAATDGTPGLIQLLDAEPEATPPFLVMSFAEGGSLADRLRDGPMPLKEALPLFRRITAAMAYLHAKGIRHCDLKPGNILLDAHGNPLIADLGQAKLPGDANPSTGTFFYMAPEQAFIAPNNEQLQQLDSDDPSQVSSGTNILQGTQGRPDTRWDVYALGAIFYHMVTGRPPHSEGSLAEQLRDTENFHRRLARYRLAICKASRPVAHHAIAGMNRRLAGIIDRCLEVNPLRRTHDAGNLLDDLHEYARWKKRRPIFWSGVVTTFLVVSLLIGFFLKQANDIIEDARRATQAQVEHDNLARAELIANGLEQILEERIDRVESFASSPQLRATLSTLQEQMSDPDLDSPPDALNHGEAAMLRGSLDTWLLEQFEQNGGYRVYSPGMAVSVLVYEGESDRARCYHVARVSGSSQSIRRGTVDQWSLDEPFWRQSWSWRDYVNGEGDDSPSDRSYRPIVRTHISQPYDSQVRGLGMICTITTPVFQSKLSRRPIGFILTSIELEKFYHWVDQPFEGSDGDVGRRDCFPTIADNRGYCFMHEGVAPKELEDKKYARVLEGTLCEIGNVEVIPDYQDPLDPGEEYITAIAWFDPYQQGKEEERGLKSWAVLVQTRTAAAERLVDGIRNELSQAGSVLIVLLAIVVGALWLWLGRLSRSVRSSEDG